MSAAMVRTALLAALFLLCAGCATAPGGAMPVNGSAADVPLPPSTRFLGQAAIYLSAAGERLEVVHDAGAGIAIVKLPDGTMTLLPAEIVGTEGRYRDSRITVWERDGGALLWIDGELVFSGRLQ